MFVFLRAVECLQCLAGLIFHALGFNDPEEPAKHQLRVYFAYFGYVLLSGRRVYKMMEMRRVPLLSEAIRTMLAFYGFTALSIYTMVDLENDPHLGFLTDKEEVNHPFFEVSKIQSVMLLILAMTLLFHALAAIQAMRTPKPRHYGQRAEILYFFIQDMFSGSRRKVKKYFQAPR